MTQFALTVMALVLLVGCQFDGSFIEEGKGAMGYLEEGKYTGTDTKSDGTTRQSELAVNISGDEYKVSSNNDITVFRMVQINNDVIAEISDGKLDKDKKCIMFGMVTRIDNGIKIVTVDDKKWDELLKTKANEWKMVEVHGTKILKDAPGVLMISGNREDKMAVIKEILLSHRDMFNNAYSITLLRVNK